MALNFGTYRGDQIISQAMQNAVQRRDQSTALAHEQKKQDAYLKIAQSNLAINQKRQLDEDVLRGLEIEKVNKQQAASGWMGQMLRHTEVKQSPIIFEDGFFTDKVSKNPDDVTKYVQVKDKDQLFKSYTDSMNKAGVEANYGEFQLAFNALLANQAQGISKQLAQMPSFRKMSQEDRNKGLSKTQAGGVLQQAMIANSGIGPLDIGYTPSSGEGGGEAGGYSTSRLLFTAGLGFRANKSIQAGRALAKAGQGTASMNTLKSLTGVSGFNKLIKVANLAKDPRGMAAIEQAVSKKYGGKVAASILRKLGTRTAASAVMAGTGVGAIGSLALTAWTLYDIYDIIDTMVE